MKIIKRIYLRNCKKYAIVDDADYEKISRYRWLGHRKPNENTWYAITRCGKKMHRVILGPIKKGAHTDHIDRNGLNNRKTNLRAATPSQNGHNSKVRTDNTSGIKGVHYDTASKKWRAQIQIMGKKFMSKVFPTKKQAVKARKEYESSLY